MTNNNLYRMMMTALFAAIIGILAQVTIPLPLIPITGQTLAVGLAETILGSRLGTVATLLYIAMGSVGIPVFAQMTGGLGVIFGPTGGFIVGFIPTAFIIGLYIEKTAPTILQAGIANIIGMFITLAFGAVWLKISANLSWIATMKSSVVPF